MICDIFSKPKAIFYQEGTDTKWKSENKSNKVSQIQNNIEVALNICGYIIKLDRVSGDDKDTLQNSSVITSSMKNRCLNHYSENWAVESFGRKQWVLILPMCSVALDVSDSLWPYGL